MLLRYLVSMAIAEQHYVDETIFNSEPGIFLIIAFIPGCPVSNRRTESVRAAPAAPVPAGKSPVLPRVILSHDVALLSSSYPYRIDEEGFYYNIMPVVFTTS